MAVCIVNLFEIIRVNHEKGADICRFFLQIRPDLFFRFISVI